MAEKISHQLILEKLNAKFGADIILSSVEEPLYKQLIIDFRSDKVVEILRFLFDDLDLEFQFLTSMFGIHYPEQQGKEIGVYYLLHNLPRNTRVRLRTWIPISNPEIETATSIFEAANWMERETYDFFGVIFKGHPNLIRILNVDDMDYFPMRKEFPLEEATRKDKDDQMFGR